MRMKKIILIFLFLLIPNIAQADCTAMNCAFEKGHAYFMQKEYAAAEEWLLKAAEQGHGEAQLRLGFMYGEHHYAGIEHDPVQSEYWLQKAVDQDVKGSKFRLAIFYMHYLKPADYTKAAKWLKRAADEDNDKSAQYDLASLYLSGNLGTADAEAAEYYLLKSAQNGHKHARIKLVHFYENAGNYKKAHEWANILAEGRGGPFWVQKTKDLKTLIE